MKTGANFRRFSSTFETSRSVSCSSGEESSARKLITEFYREEKGKYRNRVDDSVFFGQASKAEEIAKKQLIREQVDSKIKEMKALSTTGPPSGQRILRAVKKKQSKNSRSRSK